MSRVSGKFTISLAVALLITGAVGWLLFEQLDQQDRTPVRGKRTVRAVPVEVAPVQRGPMKLERTFSGALEARAQFVVAPKVAGRCWGSSTAAVSSSLRFTAFPMARCACQIACTGTSCAYGAR